MFQFEPSFLNRQRLDQRRPPFSGQVSDPHSGHAPPSATWAPVLAPSQRTESNLSGHPPSLPRWAPVLAPRQQPESSFFKSDEFRMYEFKITLCPRASSHDWMQCPYAHKGEKARRRDLRRFDYVAITCPEFRFRQQCSRGDRCIFAHGVFEYWLHPARYRTRACTAGKSCDRRVCFFAHGPAELRPQIRYRIVGETRVARGERGGEEVARPRELKLEFLERLGGTSEGVKGKEESLMGVEGDLEDCEGELVDVDWVNDLID